MGPDGYTEGVTGDVFDSSTLPGTESLDGPTVRSWESFGVSTGRAHLRRVCREGPSKH